MVQSRQGVYGRQRRALFGNAGFSVVAGSEIVIMEIAEELIRQGWACDVVAWDIGEPMMRVAQQAGIRVLSNPCEVRPFHYDLVWLQNRLEPVLDYTPSESDAPRTFFAFAHLDRSWPLSQPGVVAEGVLGQVFVVTSERAVERVVEGGLPREAVHMFRNAAPSAFEMPPPAPRKYPGRILVVSNHPPAEVLQAATLLRAAGVEVIHWGLEGDVREQRLLPADLAMADAVITIGKTVPYALRARRPAYVYDHFGGPGWLRNDNMMRVAERNFSGLCCERRVDAAIIATEVMEGFAAAAAEAAARDDAELADFQLERFVASLLEMAAPTPAEHRARLAPHAVALRAERNLALAAGTFFAELTQVYRHLRIAQADAEKTTTPADRPLTPETGSSPPRQSRRWWQRIHR